MSFFKSKKQKQTAARQPKLMVGQDDYAFRRSRTLTGTTSSKVAPSAESRSQLKTPRLKEHELRQQRSRAAKTLLLILACMGVIALVIANYIGDFAITYTQQSQGAQPKTSQYQETIKQYFSQHPFERFGFSLDDNRVEQFLKQQHSEIATVTISRDWYGGNVQFGLSFRQGILVWQVGAQRYYVDNQGVAFTYDHFGGQLVAVTDQSGISPDTGNSVASRRFILFLGRMVGAVNAGGKGKVVGVIIPPSTRQIDLRLEGRDYPIKTHIDRDPLQQAEDIIQALAYFDEKKIKPEYIDVRVGGKAFYK